MTVGADSVPAGGHPDDNGLEALAAELFRRHSRLVLAACRRLLRDPAEAEDAMQQTFVSAYRAMLAGREPQRPEVWLVAIARNECLDRIRCRMRAPLAVQARGGGCEAPDALATLIADEELRALSGSIRDLPTQQREALLLHEFHGLPYDEVAAAMGISESAIGSLLFRARRTLRSTFRRAYGLLPLPEGWNAVAHLVARGPVVKAAALPMVAKLGCGAVAVGLTAGTVVAVEHDVAKQPATSALARQAAAPRVSPPDARAAGPLRHVEADSLRHVEADSRVRQRGSIVGARLVSVRRRGSAVPDRQTHTAPVTKQAHDAAGNEAAATPAPAAPSHAAPAHAGSFHVARRSGSPRVQGHSPRASSRRDAVEHHGNGRSSAGSGSARSFKQVTKAKVPPGQARSRAAGKTGAPSGGAAGDRGNPAAQAPVDTAAPPAEASPPGPDGEHPDHPDHPDHPAHPDHPVKP